MRRADITVWARADRLVVGHLAVRGGRARAVGARVHALTVVARGVVRALVVGGAARGQRRLRRDAHCKLATVEPTLGLVSACSDSLTWVACYVRVSGVTARRALASRDVVVSFADRVGAAAVEPACFLTATLATDLVVVALVVQRALGSSLDCNMQWIRV